MFPTEDIEGFEKYWRRRKPGKSTALHYASDVRIFFQCAAGYGPEDISVHVIDWFMEWQQGLDAHQAQFAEGLFRCECSSTITRTDSETIVVVEFSIAQYLVESAI